MAGLLLVWCSLVLASVAEEVVLSSVAFVRTGERLPLLQPDGSIIALTSLGAQQAYSVGRAIRDRYIPAEGSSANISFALQGLAPNEVDPDQLYLQAEDAEFSIATGNALMQGLYPPYNSNLSRVRSNFLANGSYMPNPLDGYRYVWTHAPSPKDPTSTYTDGANDCQSFSDHALNYLDSEEMTAASERTIGVYQQAAAVLASAEMPEQSYDFRNAYAIYDYLNYMSNHDHDTHEVLTNGSVLGTDVFEQIRYFSDQYAWAEYGNVRPYAEAEDNPIGTIAGQTFAYAAVNRLQNNVASQGSFEKLSLFFGEWAPMVSFFALSDLDKQSTDFRGLPAFGSVMMFELFANTDTALYPQESDLKVRFNFRNGTDGDFVTFPLFGSNSDSMSWHDFQDSMLKVSITDTGVWCHVCNSWETTPFCLSYNDKAWKGVEETQDSEDDSTVTVTPKIAGLIGAVVTLGVVLVLLIAAVGFGGLRFSRATRAAPDSPRQSLGSFEGSQKPLSSTNLTTSARNGKKPAVSIGERDVGPNGEERPGSWEMRGDIGRTVQRSSEEDEEDSWNTIQRPVRAVERV